MGSVIGDQKQTLRDAVRNFFGMVSHDAVDALPQCVLTARLDLSEHERNKLSLALGEDEDYFFSEQWSNSLNAVESLLPFLALVRRPPFVQRRILASALIDQPERLANRAVEIG